MVPAYVMPTQKKYTGGNTVISCQACGTQNSPDAVYCTKCARKLDPETQQAVVEQRAAYLATGIDISRIVLTTVVAIIVIAVIIFLVVHGV
jgi:uncharacterized membrane protein YvbJ